MSRLLVQKNDHKKLKQIQTHLQVRKSTKKTHEIIEITVEEADQLTDLLQQILNLQPVVIDDYVSPNEAAKLSGVSRPIITEMLKSRRLLGHMTNSHWRVQKKSLLDYISQRDNTHLAISSMDKDGFGLD